VAASELVDVVDADDRVVAQATRAEVRARKLRHRATYILLFNSSGQLFVHRRSATKDICPSYDDVAVGGVVGAGESYDEGARRELAEEVGISDVAPRPMLKFQYDDGENRVNGRVYSVLYDGDLRLQEEEIAGGEWLDLDVVIERIRTGTFCPDGVEALLHYLDRLAAVSKD
jgi:isopentenyldiphosphate isomerase